MMGHKPYSLANFLNTYTSKNSKRLFRSMSHYLGLWLNPLAVSQKTLSNLIHE